MLPTIVCFRPGIAFVPMRLNPCVVAAIVWEQIWSGGAGPVDIDLSECQEVGRKQIIGNSCVTSASRKSDYGSGLALFIIRKKKIGSDTFIFVRHRDNSRNGVVLKQEPTPPSVVPESQTPHRHMLLESAGSFKSCLLINIFFLFCNETHNHVLDCLSKLWLFCWMKGMTGGAD